MDAVTLHSSAKVVGGRLVLRCHPLEATRTAFPAWTAQGWVLEGHRVKGQVATFWFRRLEGTCAF